MYCPKCGTQNNDNAVKFCRGCGEDLQLVAHALTKRESWHMNLVRKYDDYLNSQQPRAAESVFFGVLVGGLLLFAGLVNLIGKGFDGFVWTMLVLGIAMLIMPIPEYRRYKRGLSKQSREEKLEPRIKGDLSIYQPSRLSAGEPAEVFPAKTTGELLTANLHKEVAPPSVTEHTTKHLDSTNKRQTR